MSIKSIFRQLNDDFAIKYIALCLGILWTVVAAANWIGNAMECPGFVSGPVQSIAGRGVIVGHGPSVVVKEKALLERLARAMAEGRPVVLSYDREGWSKVAVGVE